MLIGAIIDIIWIYILVSQIKSDRWFPLYLILAIVNNIATPAIGLLFISHANTMKTQTNLRQDITKLYEILDIKYKYFEKVSKDVFLAKNYEDLKEGTKGTLIKIISNFAYVNFYSKTYCIPLEYIQMNIDITTTN